MKYESANRRTTTYLIDHTLKFKGKKKLDKFIGEKYDCQVALPTPRSFQICSVTFFDKRNAFCFFLLDIELIES